MDIAVYDAVLFIRMSSADDDDDEDITFDASGCDLDYRSDIVDSGSSDQSLVNTHVHCDDLQMVIRTDYIKLCIPVHSASISACSIR